MQSLNLSGESKKSDGRLRSLFWPTVENAWDVDYLGIQGFWLCWIIGVLNLVIVACSAYETANPIARIVLLVTAFIFFFIYVVGGMGMRQTSFPAAVFIFILYVFGQLASGHMLNILSIIISAVLLSNVRATYLASRWKPAAEGEDLPMRFNETFRDKLVDQLPSHAWPFLKYPFYLLALLLILMLASNSALILLRPQPFPVLNKNATPRHLSLPLAQNRNNHH
ncbi:hypothetical protein ACOBR2_00200 [Telmatobacter bradus]|uniref:hypothetical protein n=1 Tax=Telmatobacter bradus TaxID=474953 RepID=UPI003B4320B3